MISFFSVLLAPIYNDFFGSTLLNIGPSMFRVTLATTGLMAAVTTSIKIRSRRNIDTNSPITTTE